MQNGLQIATHGVPTMEKKDWKKLSRIFDKVLTLPQENRTAYIKNICGNDSELEKKVRDMLDKIEESDQYFEEQFEKNQAVIDELDSLLENAGKDEDYFEGKTIGRWVVTELIGRGGMGSVYRAQRTDESGIHQIGALKIVHHSLITPSHIERFKLEQQILSGLQHPNISGFIDSGITDDGIPYMVMEYVEGEPILEYCNRQNLSIEKRLEIFKVICRTIQYAHKSLIVHRDLKPENILVTKDRRVKILDFGIAKLLDPNVYEGSAIETKPGMRLLSLEYASPEQISGAAITTSTDIYSLGVLLYKLLTGLHPFDVDGHSYREVEKMVLEQNAPLLSSRLGSLSNRDQLEKISRSRKTDPSDLIKKMKGDLDAIVNKALRKDPERRFDSVESLLIDIDRYQNELPIYARPDSVGYRARKFLHRHRWAVSAVAMIILALTAGLATTLWQAEQARQNAEQARQNQQQAEQVSDFLIELFEESDPTEANDGSKTAREMLDQGFEKVQTELEDQPAIQAQMLGIIGKVYTNLGLYEQAYPALEQAVAGYRNIGETSTDYASILLLLSNLHYRLGEMEEAEVTARESLEMTIDLYGPDHPEVASVLNTLALALEELGEMEEAYEAYYRVIEIRRQNSEQNSNLAANLNNLAILLQEDGQLDEADELFKEAVALVEDEWGEEHPYMAYTLSGYSGVHQDRGEYDLAEDDLQRALKIGLVSFPPEHPFIAVVLYNLGGLFEEMENYSEAINYYEQGLTLRRNSLPPEHPDIATSLDATGTALVKAERAAEAEPLFREALTIRENDFEENDWRIAQVESHLGRCLLLQHKYDEAELLLAKSHPILDEALGPDNLHTQRALEDLKELQKLTGHTTDYSD